MAACLAALIAAAACAAVIGCPEELDIPSGGLYEKVVASL